MLLFAIYGGWDYKTYLKSAARVSIRNLVNQGLLEYILCIFATQEAPKLWPEKVLCSKNHDITLLPYKKELVKFNFSILKVWKLVILKPHELQEYMYLFWKSLTVVIVLGDTKWIRWRLENNCFIFSRWSLWYGLDYVSSKFPIPWLREGEREEGSLQLILTIHRL